MEVLTVRPARSPMIRRATWALALVVSVLTALAAAAEPLRSIPNPRVQNGTWVTDMPRALRADTVSRLNEQIAALERDTGIEMAVVVMRSLDGLSIEEAAADLAVFRGEVAGLQRELLNGFD